MKFKIYETALDHLKGQPLTNSYKLLGETDADNVIEALKTAKTDFPNKLGYRVANGDIALDFSETLCVMCGIGKVGMWVGGNTEPRRVIRVCPKCDGQERVGKISS